MIICAYNVVVHAQIKPIDTARMSSHQPKTPDVRYPLIPVLSSFNPIFKQYTEDVTQSYVNLRNPYKKADVQLSFYRYQALQSDTLLSVAARCNIPYETLATLNRIANGNDPIAGKMLFLPTVPGLFITLKPQTDIELMLHGKEFESQVLNQAVFVRYENDITENLLFYQNERLNATERAFFLDRGFMFPLPKAIETSAFGMRKNPVSGNFRFHEGIDLAASKGTAVYASRGGEIIFCGYDAIYGNHVIIQHDNNSRTVYGHLDSILVELKQKVTMGYTIGRVGSTGQSTGPHLHFEIRINGQAQNPNDLVRKKESL